MFQVSKLNTPVIIIISDRVELNVTNKPKTDRELFSLDVFYQSVTFISFIKSHENFGVKSIGIIYLAFS